MNFNSVYFYNLLESELGVSLEDFPRSDITYRDYAKVSLLKSILKKWQPRDTQPLEAIAISKFLECNTRCANFSLTFANSFIEDTFKLAKHKLDVYFHSDELQSSHLTLSKCLDKGRTGPGASVGTRHTDFFNKMFNGPLTTTDYGLYAHYVTSVSTRWRRAELSRFTSYGITLVEGSKLSTVPKNTSTNRTICTEPSLNMFYQLGAGLIMEDLLQRYHNIDLSVQPDINKTMAKIGSIEGIYATIDLSSASDTIALSLLEYLLPNDTLSLLKLLRSENTFIGKEKIPLHMISSMGNGFTFPLQTLIFATLVRSAYEILGIKPVSYGPSRNYSVFGDDIICLSSAYNFVCQILEVAGFTVNHDKSFAVGPFRESCGSDFFKGYDTRGVYLKGINCVQDAYSLFNRLVRWSMRHNVDISRTLLYVKGLVEFRPVPLHSGDTEGHIVPQDHVREYHRNRNGSLVYRCTVPCPVKRSLTKSILNRNPEGVLTAALGGYLTGGKVTKKNDSGTYFTLRSRKVKYKVVYKVTPYWDHIIHPGLATRDYLYTFRLMDLYIVC